MIDLPDGARDLRRFLHGLPGVDEVGAAGRVQALATRSIKTTAKAWAIDTIISMVDLTTLEGADTPPLLAETRQVFDSARLFKPKASRGASRETYVVAEGYRGPRETHATRNPGPDEPRP